MALNGNIEVLNISGVPQATVDKLETLAAVALSKWSAVIAADCDVDIQISIVDSTPSGRAQGGVGDIYVTGGPNGGTTFEGAPGWNIRHGDNPNGTNPEFVITIAKDYLLNELFLDTTPSTSTDIPSGKTDALSVLIHEMGHGLGFIGYYNESTNTFGGHSPYDWRVKVAAGEAYFDGPNVRAVYGKAVPLTDNNYTHYGNTNSFPSASNMLTGLMNGVVFYRGHRYEISNLDLAYLADMGIGTTRNDIFDQTWLDIINGGAGDDVFRGNYSYSATSVTIDGSGAIRTAPGLQLIDVERLEVTLGSGDDAFIGTENSDWVSGGNGSDTLEGRSGADTLVGGAGVDTLIGGVGNDIYVASFGDTVTESIGGGIDTVETALASFVVPGAVEILRFTGTGNFSGLGNSAANQLYGAAGNDTLNGGAGADKCWGGLGDDTYIVDMMTDVVTEYANAGVDTIQASVTYTLSVNVENLTQTGISNINGSGNASNNILRGNAGNNSLYGNAGNDTLVGNGGSDVLFGGVGADNLYGGVGQDAFVLNTAIGAGQVDRFSDFNVADDTIRLENAVFTKLATPGTLSASNFHVGTTAADTNDYVVYNKSTGALFYDSNGSTAGNALQIATLSVNLALTAADFLVI